MQIVSKGTICMKRQGLFAEKKRKKYFMSPAEIFTQSAKRSLSFIVLLKSLELLFISVQPETACAIHSGLKFQWISTDTFIRL